MLVTLCSILGVTVTWACQQIYGGTSWNPSRSSCSGTTEQPNLSALHRMFALIGTNISANSVSIIDLSLASQMHQCEEGVPICAVLSQLRRACDIGTSNTVPPLLRQSSVDMLYALIQCGQNGVSVFGF